MKETGKGLWQIIKGLGGLLICIFVFMALFGVFDDEAEEIGNAEIFKGNDTKSVFSDASQVRVTEDGEVVAESKPKEDETETAAKADSTGGSDTDSTYLQAGFSYSLQDGSECAITDINMIYDWQNQSNIGYVLVEFTNNSDDTEYLGPDDISVFVDDFQESVDISVPISINNVEYTGEWSVIDPGRKGRYVYFTLFPSSSETAEKVELSLYGGSILFKEDGMWLYGDN